MRPRATESPGLSAPTMAALLCLLWLPLALPQSANGSVTLADDLPEINVRTTVIFDAFYVFNPQTGQADLVTPREVLTDVDEPDYLPPFLGLPALLNGAIPLQTRTFVDDGVTVTPSAYAFSDVAFGVEDDGGTALTEFSSSISHDAFYDKTPSQEPCCGVSANAQSNLAVELVVSAPTVVSAQVEFSGDRGSGGNLRVVGNGVDIDIRKNFNDEGEPPFSESATATLAPGRYQFRQSSYANARNNIPGMRHFEGEIRLTFESGPPKVVLAFGAPANAAIREDQVFGAEFSNVIVNGQATLLPFTSTDTAAFDSFKESVRASVQDVLERATAGNLALDDIEVVIGAPEPGAMNIFFIDGAQLAVVGLEGRAYTGVDQFNEEDGGEAFVVMRSDQDLTGSRAEAIAERTGHEVGHLLGLIHIDPSGSVPVMDYDHQPNEAEAFSNTIATLTEPPRSGGIERDGVTHNPLYHLLRYTGDHSHDALIAAQVFPGTWDLQRASDLSVQISSNFEGAAGATSGNTALYDVSVLEADGDPSAPRQLAHFDEITFTQLAQEEFRISERSGLVILAASKLGAPRDVALTLGDPFLDQALVLYPGAGELDGFMRVEAATPEGYETLAAITVEATPVPEPNGTALSLVATGLVLGLGRRRRRSDAARVPTSTNPPPQP